MLAMRDQYPRYFDAVYHFPHYMAGALLLVLLTATLSAKAKGLFLVRIAIVLTVATVLAHVNRWFLLWPADPFFVSGHMTFSFGAAVGMGLLRPWTLVITLPLLVPYGAALVFFGFHTTLDVLGAIPLVLAIYAAMNGLWPFWPKSPPLDMAVEST